MIATGFQENKMDEYVYLKVSDSKFIFLVLYIDDILLASLDISLLHVTKRVLTENFVMKDLGEAQFALGIEIIRDRNKNVIGLSQKQYIDRVTRRYNMEKCSSGELPIGKGDKMSAEQSPKNELEKESMKDKPYASLVGSLMYAQVCTRPDLAFAVSVLGRFQSNPATKQAIWLRNMVNELSVVDNIEKPLRIYCDNKALVFFSKNNKRSLACRLMDIKYLKVRDEVRKGTLDIQHINTKMMIADPKTKALSMGVFK
ncbi:unnamed protein product [Malus baccata var. baccata]